MLNHPWGMKMGGSVVDGFCLFVISNSLFVPENNEENKDKRS